MDGGVDSGFIDAGNSDAGSSAGQDAGESDGGAEGDAGESDAGNIDVGETDAGALDAGSADSGSIDAGGPTPDAGPDFRVFLMRGLSRGNFGGLDGGDRRCQLAAEAANLGGEWRAWLAVSGVNAASRLPSSGRWWTMDRDGGQLAFPSADALLSGPLVPIQADEYGSTAYAFPYGYPFTGADDAGAPTGFDCLGWTTEDAGTAGTLARAQNPALWTNLGAYACDGMHPLYCFEVRQSLPAVIPDAGLGPHKRVFVTSQKYSANFGGVIGADARCQSSADSAGIGGTWKAYLASSTEDAPERIADVSPWYENGDGGLLLFSTHAQLYGYPSAPITHDEWGNVVSPQPYFAVYWTGAGFQGLRDPNGSCGDWTNVSSNAATYGGAGDHQNSSTPNVDRTFGWCGYWFPGCSSTERLLCFEQ